MKRRVSTIEQVELIPVEPELVFQALTDPAMHAEFTGAKASGEAVEGETFTAWDGYIRGRHLKLVAGKKIVQEWETTEWPPGFPPSVLEIELERAPGGTRLRMKQTGVPEEQAESYRKGWTDYYWEPLRRYFEGR